MSTRDPAWLRRLERLALRAERGDPEAQAWVGFLNWTALCAAVLAGTLVLWIWF